PSWRGRTSGPESGPWAYLKPLAFLSLASSRTSRPLSSYLPGSVRLRTWGFDTRPWTDLASSSFSSSFGVRWRSWRGEGSTIWLTGKGLALAGPTTSLPSLGFKLLRFSGLSQALFPVPERDGLRGMSSRESRWQRSCL